MDCAQVPKDGTHISPILFGASLSSRQRFDNDVWIRLNVNGDVYDYLCTHVEDFMICAKDAKTIMDCIKNVYTIKDIAPLNYYLGNDYKKDR